jgi:hypothetical protein
MVKHKIAAMLAAGSVAATSLVAGVLPAVAAPRDASGCNHHVCIEVTGKPAGYQARGFATAGQFGHVDIWGPGLKATSGKDRINPSVSGSGHGYGQVCAEFWHPDRPGHWVSDGLACEDVH